MGLFRTKKLLNPQHMSKITQAANEAHMFLPGSMEGSVLAFKDARVDFLEAQDRERFMAVHAKVLEQSFASSSPGTYWARRYSELDSLPKDDEYRFLVTGTLAAKSLLMSQLVVKAALDFPRDERLQQMAQTLIHEVFQIYVRYYGDSILLEFVELVPELEKFLMGDLAGDWSKDPE